jgi:glycine betaine/proline transport system permease protein
MRDNLYEIPVGQTAVGTGPLSAFIIIYLLDPLDVFLQEWLAWPVIILIFTTLAVLVSGWKLGVGTAVTLLLLGMLGMWQLAMVTLSQVIVAVVLSLLIAIPLGIWSAQNNTIEAILRPILDFLQTIPTFVYLVPVIMLFDVGRVPGIMASVFYALPPAIRLTNLGIRQTDPQVVEAALAFGSTSRQTLTKVQLPLALPSIMAGINQTVMMVLAMVVIAGMVGGAGLGLAAVNGLSRNQLGQGIEAGLAIVIIAIVLDRLLQAFAERQKMKG